MGTHGPVADPRPSRDRGMRRIQVGARALVPEREQRHRGDPQPVTGPNLREGQAGLDDVQLGRAVLPILFYQIGPTRTSAAARRVCSSWRRACRNFASVASADRSCTACSVHAHADRRTLRTGPRLQGPRPTPTRPDRGPGPQSQRDHRSTAARRTVRSARTARAAAAAGHRRCPSRPSPTPPQHCRDSCGQEVPRLSDSINGSWTATNMPPHDTSCPSRTLHIPGWRCDDDAPHARQSGPNLSGSQPDRVAGLTVTWSRTAAMRARRSPVSRPSQRVRRSW